MEVRAHDDPSAWLEAVLPLLMLDEARHDLCLGLVHTLVHHPSVYPSKYLWSVEDAGTVVGAALQTPPHNLILGQPSAEGANDLLAEAIESAGIQLPGVVGGLPEAEAFAVAWCARTGHTARTSRPRLRDDVGRRPEPAATRERPALLFPPHRPGEPNVERDLPEDRVPAGLRFGRAGLRAGVSRFALSRSRAGSARHLSG